VDSSLPGKRIIEVLERTTRQYGLPKIICLDNGPEFSGQVRALDQWTHQRGAKLQFSRPGKPKDNATVATFNAKVRGRPLGRKCLDQHWFVSLEEAKQQSAEAKHHLKVWRREYNDVRPHSSLGDLTPAEFAATSQQ
jgi:putative transposase